MGLADQCSGVLVRVGSRKQKVPGSSLIIGGDFSFLLIFDLFVFNSNDSENFLSVNCSRKGNVPRRRHLVCSRLARASA